MVVKELEEAIGHLAAAEVLLDVLVERWTNVPKMALNRGATRFLRAHIITGRKLMERVYDEMQLDEGVPLEDL